MHSLFLRTFLHLKIVHICDIPHFIAMQGIIISVQKLATPGICPKKLSYFSNSKNARIVGLLRSLVKPER